MSQRIQQRFQELKTSNRAGLITFTMAFDPDEATSLDILRNLPAAGADLIELGMPFSDPMADGPVIDAAGKRALKAGATLKKILALVKQFRTTDNTTPLILMGYYNPVYHYGVEAFCTDTAAAGVDGVILVDLPPEEEAEFVPHAQKRGLSLVRLIAPTTDDARLPALLKSASGFVYYISIKGITGAASASPAELEKQIARIRKHTDLPVAIGFGIKTAEQVKQAGKIADAVVVGSALVNKIANENPPAALQFVKSLAS